MSTKSSHNSRETFADRLLKARRQSRAKAKDVAANAGISGSYYSEIEHGAKPPPEDLAAKFAKFLNVDLRWLLYGLGDSPAFSEHLRMLEEARSCALGRGSVESEQQTAMEAALDMSKIWRGRALEAEKRLASVADALVQLAESLRPSLPP